MIFTLKHITLAHTIRFSLFIFILFIPMKTVIYQISFGFFILFCGIYFFKNHTLSTLLDFEIEHKKLMIAFALVIGSMLCSNLLSSYTTFDSWKIILEYIFRYFLFFILLMNIYKNAIITKRFIVIAITCALLLQGIDGVYQAVMGIDFIRGNLGSMLSEGSFSGLKAAMFHRNTFGLFMAIGVTLCTVLLIAKNDPIHNRAQTIFMSFALPCFIFGLLFSYSRSAWVFCGVFLLLYLSKNYKQLTRQHYTILSLLVISIVYFFFYFDTLLLRLIQLIHLNSSDRDIIWTDSLRLIQMQPLFGYGLMTYQKIASQNTFSVHNSLLEIILFLGIIGFTTFSFLLFVILQKIIQIKDSILFAFFFAFLTVSQFDHSIISNTPMLSALSLFAFFIFGEKNNRLG